MKKLIIILTILTGLTFAGQYEEHVFFSLRAIELTEAILSANHLLILEPVAYPIAGLASHFLTDMYVDEAGRGQWQIEIGVIGAVVGWFAQPTPKLKDRYLTAALWGALIPDSILKKQMHPDGYFNPAFHHTLDSEQFISSLFQFANISFRISYEL